MSEPASDDEVNAHLKILGHVGFTAWTGMVHIGAVRAGEVVYVSGAAGPSNCRNLILQEVTMRGFIVTAHKNPRGRFELEVGDWLEEGRIRSVREVFDGIDRVPGAFEPLLSEGSSPGHRLY